MKFLPTFQFCIAPGNVCNLGCPSCPAGRKDTHEHTVNQWMTPDALDLILTKATRECRIPRVSLVGWTEPTLNSRLPELVNVVHSHGIACWITTNLTHEIDLPSLLDTKPELIGVSDSGIDAETYAIDHPGGDWRRMKQRLWDMARTRHPQTAMNLIWHRYRYNEHQMEPMRRLCQAAGITFFPVTAKVLGIKAMIAGFQGEPNALEARLLQSFADMRDLCHRHSSHLCREMTRSITLDSSGRVRVCGIAELTVPHMGHFLGRPLAEIVQDKQEHGFCRLCLHHGAHNWANETLTWKRRLIDYTYHAATETLGRVINLHPSMKPGLSADRR